MVAARHIPKCSAAERTDIKNFSIVPMKSNRPPLRTDAIGEATPRTAHDPLPRSRAPRAIKNVIEPCLAPLSQMRPKRYLRLLLHQVPPGSKHTNERKNFMVDAFSIRSLISAFWTRALAWASCSTATKLSTGYPEGFPETCAFRQVLHYWAAI